jgi:hypothetical protein
MDSGYVSMIKCYQASVFLQKISDFSFQFYPHCASTCQATSSLPLNISLGTVWRRGMRSGSLLRSPIPRRMFVLRMPVVWHVVHIPSCSSQGQHSPVVDRVDGICNQRQSSRQDGDGNPKHTSSPFSVSLQFQFHPSHNDIQIWSFVTANSVV